jgi:phage shock protein A
MTAIRRPFALACAALLSAGGLSAQDAPAPAAAPRPAEQPAANPALAAKWEKATDEELRVAVNQLADASVRQAQAVEETTARLDAAWLDPANTSPKLDALRKQLQALETQLLALRQAIRRETEELPAIKAQREAVDKERAKLDATKAERAYVQTLFQARLKANREGGL